MRHRVPAPRIEPHRGAAGLVHHRGHELTLVDHSVQVGPRGRPGSHVAQCVAAVEGLAARGQVDPGQRVIDRIGRAHLDTTERVDHHREAVETHLGVVVEMQARRLLDGLGQQRRAALGERGVDLVLAVAGDVHVGVAGDRDHRGGRVGAERRDVHHQDGVGPAVAQVAAGGQLRPAAPGSGRLCCRSRRAATWCPRPRRAGRRSRTPRPGAGWSRSRTRRRRARRPPAAATTISVTKILRPQRLLRFGCGACGRRREQVAARWAAAGEVAAVAAGGWRWGLPRWWRWLSGWRWRRPRGRWPATRVAPDHLGGLTQGRASQAAALDAVSAR